MKHIVLITAIFLSGCFIRDGNFMPTSDQELYGKADHWTYPMLDEGIFPGKFDDLYYGDCEDYAIKRIVDAGRGQMLIVKPERQPMYERRTRPNVNPLLSGAGMWKRTEPELHAVALIDGVVYDINRAYTRKPLGEYEVLSVVEHDELLKMIDNPQPMR